MPADIPETSSFKIAVLTRRWSWYGEYVLQLLAQRGVSPELILVENTPLRTRLVLARRLARRIGCMDALRYNFRFWLPLFRRSIGLDRTAPFPYEQYSGHVIEASDINAPEMVAGLVKHQVDRIVLAHSGIIRQPIMDASGAWIINAHPGALPRMRGVDVIRWSILEGIPPAISTHVVDSGVDTGPILDQETVLPRATETLGQFERRLTEMAATRLVDFALAGPGNLPEPRRQALQDGRQYYLMPFRLQPRVEALFESMKTKTASHDSD